jgi:hypothetical protein
MPSTLTDKDWELILGRIKDGKCTPFLGAGASVPRIPLGGDIAEKWVTRFNCPMRGCRDLPRVAQYLAVNRGDSMFPKEEIVREFFNNVQFPDFEQFDEPHRVLASLPLPVYLTTNYDHFMLSALQARNKNPKLQLCLWNQVLQRMKSIFADGFQPTTENPVVFHLHGHYKNVESLVLTEDDYLDFMVNLGEDRDQQKLLPVRIEQAFTGASLLFVGYSLSDWDFRVLFRGIVMSLDKSLRRLSVAVQLPPEEKLMEEYWEDYFQEAGMKIFWGKAREFAAELNRRWKEFNN